MKATTFFLLLGTIIVPAHAGIITSYDDATQFNNDTSAMNTTVCDFESSAVGDVINSGSNLCGITFNYDIGGLPITVNDHFDTLSGTNSLGIDGAEFWLGDSVNMSFGQTVHAFGLYIITSLVDIFPDDFGLDISGQTVTSTLTVHETLADGGSVLFLGIQDTAGFNSINFFSNLGCIGCAVFNVDDITYASADQIPEPSSLWLFVLALVLTARFLTRRTKPSIVAKSHGCI